MVIENPLNRRVRRPQAALPPPIPLSKWDRFKLWFAANRMLVGKAVGATAALFRIIFTFQGHTEIAEFLVTIADILLVGSAYTIAAGAPHKSDQHYKEQKRELETVPPVHKAKLLEVPHRRASDPNLY